MQSLGGVGIAGDTHVYRGEATPKGSVWDTHCVANVQCTWGGDPEVEARGGGPGWRHGMEAWGRDTVWRPGVETRDGGMK